MQYLGGKKRLIASIFNEISNKLPKTSTFVDLFSGSGVVSYAASNLGYNVLANDLQPYSYLITKVLLQPVIDAKISSLLTSLAALSDDDLFSGSRAKYRDEVKLERKLIRGVIDLEVDWTTYKIFLEKNKVICGSAESAKLARIEDVNSLFLAYYRNTYFGIEQCAEIDLLHQVSTTLDQYSRDLLVAATISSMSYLVNSTTHLAQFLKPSSGKNTHNILRKNDKSIKQLVCDRIRDFSDTAVSARGTATNLDFQEALSNLDFETLGETVIYADPPYFKEHYSRYYHVLDTFVLYDFPTLTINSQTGKTTSGRYRTNREVSDFGLKTKAALAFTNLATASIQNNCNLVVSYADSSLVQKGQLTSILEDVGYHVEITEFNLKHSGQGQARHKDVIEYLFVCKKKQPLDRLLTKVNPTHDYPGGLIHPYWARKPLNIIEQIINKYTVPNDLVFDPFMGSGTTIIAALKSGRTARGADINPLSVLMSRVIVLCAGREKELTNTLNEYAEKLNLYALDLYKISTDEAVERERYSVDGSFSHGTYQLKMIEQEVKPIVNGVLKGKVKKESNVCFLNTPPDKYLKSPIDFNKVFFTTNTRIAIYSGASAADYFTEKNISFINYARSLIDSSQCAASEREMLTLFLSSLIPLLRLSDRKASSQWPYWRPKDSLTSRNPIVALKKRKLAFEKCIEWAGLHMPVLHPDQTNLEQISVDDVEQKANEEITLILTDPPYADHAPYLEYSEMFLTLALGTSGKKLYSKEIVKTDAVGRKGDNHAYTERMERGISRQASLLKQDGYLAMFYVDKNLDHWLAIKKATSQVGLLIVEVTHFPKQRRSMKTVASPGKTLDGDLLIVFQKQHITSSMGTISLEYLVTQVGSGEVFERFSKFIEMLFSYDVLIPKNQKNKNILRMI